VGSLLFDPLALVREVIPPTPLEPAPSLDPEREILLKREDLGPNGAFKWRGALCACTAFHAAGMRAVVTSSTGNHGAATAWAAARLGMEAHVVVPEGANPAKTAIIQSYGARLYEHGTVLDETAARAVELADELGAAFFEDGASDAQLGGTGTIGLELAGEDLDAVVTPLACGALAGGMARSLASAVAKPRIIGVQSSAFPRLGTLWRGEPDPGRPAGVSFADGLADNRIVEPAFSACRDHVDDVLAVDDEALAQAILELRSRCGILVEGAAAAPLAALRVHPERIPMGRVALLVSGRNLDPAVAETILASGTASA
jgi:threonine dehydratase